MSTILIYSMIIAGSIIMLINIILYVHYERMLINQWKLGSYVRLLRIPIVMLVLFLAGYIYDGIQMDIQMPVLDGYEAAKEIRALQDPAKASVPIVAMTANAFAEDKKNAEKAGMNGHIAKPLDPDEMKRVLGKVLCK